MTGHHCRRIFPEIQALNSSHHLTLQSQTTTINHVPEHMRVVSRSKIQNTFGKSMEAAARREKSVLFLPSESYDHS